MRCIRICSLALLASAQLACGGKVSEEAISRHQQASVHALELRVPCSADFGIGADAHVGEVYR
jgi:hypothetical protein